MSANSSRKGPGSTSRGAKSKQTKLLVLKISSSSLLQFPHEQASSKASSEKSPPSESSSTPAVAAKEHSPATQVKTEGGADAPNEPTLDNASVDGQAPPEGKKKGFGGPKPGVKRRLGAMTDGQPKPRGKPGPKRKKMDGEDNGRPWTTPAAGGAGHKLGPKANQGAINAGLRALDRTGKPCRKWQKAGFSIKSFTGNAWSLSSWAAPRPPQQDGIHGAGEGAENVTPNSASDNQRTSSNVGSEASRDQAPDGQPDLVSSPPTAAPVVAASA